MNHVVTYRVDGTAGSASVTWKTPTGTSQADSDLPLLNKAGGEGLTFTNSFAVGDFLYVSAQNQSRTGTVMCTILVDGVVVAENETSADFGIATCEGRA